VVYEGSKLFKGTDPNHANQGGSLLKYLGADQREQDMTNRGWLVKTTMKDNKHKKMSEMLMENANSAMENYLLERTIKKAKFP